MSRTACLHELSNELLKDILEYIDSDPEKCVSIDRRAYLSVESFRPPSPPLPSQAQDIASFRLVCRKFGELGIPHQFTRIATRFSRDGFQRLDRICSNGHLTKHTRKFSYLIPYFYVQGIMASLPVEELAGLTCSQVEIEFESFYLTPTAIYIHLTRPLSNERWTIKGILFVLGKTFES